MKRAIVALAALALVGCGSLSIPVPKTPAQTVFELETGYAAGLALAVQYRRLPACPAVVACADQSVLAKLRQADAVAQPALSAAEKAVRTPGFGSDAVATALAGAQQAVAAFVAISATLKVQ